MKKLRLTCLVALLAAVAWSTLVAQDAAEEERPPPPAFEDALPLTLPVQLEGDRQDLRMEIVVHRWSDRGDQDEGGQRFTVSVVEQPPFMKNIRWEDGPDIEFAAGEHSRTVTLLFDTAAEGATSDPEEDARLVLLVVARHEAVVPPERELEIPLHFTRALSPGEAAVSVCALREDTPEELPAAEAFSYCDPERVPPLRSDRIVVFFTPARDLREPIGEDQFFDWRILGPNGDRVAFGEFWDKGSAGAPELTMEFATEDSPGRFAVPLQLWDTRDDPDPAKARKGPGTYTLQTVDTRVEGSAVLGQGQVTTVIDGEWRDEGTFEIGGVRLAFAGFVAEEVQDLTLPEGPYKGSMTVDAPGVAGSSVTIEMHARWRIKPEDPEQRAGSRLTLDFPPELRPEYKEVGSFSARLEVLEASDASSPLFFTAGVQRLVTTTKAPPDRHLVEGGAIPAFWEPLLHKTRDCGGAQWLWTQGHGGANPEPTEGSCTVDLELSAGYWDAVFGDPERELAAHLHDPTTLWVIPVFYSLVDHEYPSSAGRDVTVRSYGYAIYAAEPYTGPAPSGRPASGEGGGEGETGTEEGAGEGTVTGTGTGTDSGTEAGAGNGTGSGSGRGSGTGTTVVPPGPIDTSNPGGLDPDRQPRVASLVREWLAVAEPPENAVPGVSFRYDELGRLIGGGGTSGRTIGAHDSVDYGTGASSEAKVWSALRAELDSIDHCTLEEYVLAKLEERSIDHCRGRFGAVRDLAGVALSEARGEVQGAGFEASLAPGSPAPTPQDEGTVERQEPPASQYLRRGQSLTLVVHAPYIAAGAAVPDVAGLGISEARRRLEQSGLDVALRPGSPAPTPDQSETVESQEPAAGTRVEAGARVSLWVHSPFVAMTTIPAVVGMTPAEARATLAAAGIDAASVSLAPGNPAPTPDLAGRVESQSPAEGLQVDAGGRVTLRVHSGYVDLRQVPAVAGLPVAEAKRLVAAAGLGVRLLPGSPAPSPEAEGLVESQSPAAGSSVAADAVVGLVVPSPFVAAVPTPAPTVIVSDTRHRDWDRFDCARTGNSDWYPQEPPPGRDRDYYARPTVGADRDGNAMVYCQLKRNPRVRRSASYDTLVTISWQERQSGGGSSALCGSRDWDDRRYSDKYLRFFSGSRAVEVNLRFADEDPISMEEVRPIAQAYIRAVEPDAVPCTGAVRPTPPPPPTSTPTARPQPRGTCYIQEYPGRGEVNLVFEQRAQGGHVNLHLMSVPADTEMAISLQMGGIGAGLAGRYSSYQEARSAADAICARIAGGGGGPPPTATPRPAPPACPGPAVTEVYNLWNPPPYGGLGGLICRDSSGGMWINVSNNIHPVTGIQPGQQDPASGCWWGTKVVTPGHTYEGKLCPK